MGRTYTRHICGYCKENLNGNPLAVARHYFAHVNAGELLRCTDNHNFNQICYPSPKRYAENPDRFTLYVINRTGGSRWRVATLPEIKEAMGKANNVTRNSVQASRQHKRIEGK